MSEWIRIRVKDFYKDAIGETEYTYVTKEVYEALTETFRKEAHAQEMNFWNYIGELEGTLLQSRNMLNGEMLFWQQ